jgi:hypothetical protein
MKQSFFDIYIHQTLRSPAFGLVERAE